MFQWVVMRYNKQELLSLATHPSQKFDEEGIRLLQDRQEDDSHSSTVCWCFSESWWGTTNKSCWHLPLSHHRSLTRRAYFCCESGKKASFAELRVCFVFAFSTQCLHRSSEAYVNTPLVSYCSYFVVLCWIWASFLNSDSFQVGLSHLVIRSAYKFYVEIWMKT